MKKLRQYVGYLSTHQHAILHSIIAGILSVGAFLILATDTFAQVPAEYVPNYAIKSSRDAITQSFVSLQASSKIGQQPDVSVFQSLNTNFQRIFPSFPRDNSYKVVYEQCLLLSQSLGNQYSRSDFDTFLGNCFDPLDRIMQEIASKFTIQAVIAANPKQGSAPHTVTFDARNSIDPSNATIPSNNFYRYFKDTDGIDRIIGQGPVVNYTFEKEGNYIVHLTVRSANQGSEGIFDGEAKISIDVSPQAATISIFVGGQRMREDQITKISSQDALRGVIVDASATLAKGGRKIISHKRDIKNDKGFAINQSAETVPGALRVVFPQDGEYSVALTVKDNEQNELTKIYRLVVSDPIAVIRGAPANGTTTTMFSFDAAASYSVASSIKSYKRDIINEQGDKIETLQTKDFKKTFAIPGPYKIILTVTDLLGQTNTDTLQLYVDSTPPVAQFTMEPVLDWKYPSQYIFDAGGSLDDDVVNGNDTLTYDWKFSNNDTVVRDRSEQNGKRIIVSFNQKGEYQVQLTVRDSFGKVGEIQKTIRVESGLRPVIKANPTATSRGTPINFTVQSNKPLVSYNRSFGDGQTRNVQTNVISHSYEKAGIYEVKLSVVDPSGEENEVSKKIFIGEKNSPVGSYVVKDQQGQILLQSDSCRNIPAYRIDRQQEFKIDISESVNIKGESDKDLNVFFQPRNDDIFNTKTFSYKFPELGCTYVDLTVEDTTIGKNDRKRIYFKVVNALPKINNLFMTFPQYGNDVGVGFNAQKQKDLFKTSYDPLIVKVSAQTPTPADADGVVSYYTRYYYKKENPSRLLEIKVTPNNIPYVFFSIPREAGEYVFGVKLTDNDGGETKSEDIIGNGPIVIFPADAKSVDVPIVTMKQDKINIEAGETVTFDVTARILSNRPDFLDNRVFKYDFDSDGVIDLITKNDRAQYTYTKPGTYTARVTVFYRNFAGTDDSESIEVKQGLKPQFIYQTYDKTVLIKDTSIGQLESRLLCMDLRNCKKIDNIRTDKNADTAVFTYPAYGKYATRFEVVDAFGNNASARKVIEVTPGNNTDTVNLISIPAITTSGNQTFINVGSNLNNEVVRYIQYTAAGECYLDTNILVDSSKTGDPANNKDVSCNSLTTSTFNPQYDALRTRLHYQAADGRLVTKDILVNFLDYEIKLTPAQQQTYTALERYIESLDTSKSKVSDLKVILENLRRSLIDGLSTSAEVVTVRNFVATEKPDLSEQQKTQLEDILIKLDTESTKAAGAGSVYEIAKADVLSLLPIDLRAQVQPSFDQIDTANGNQETIKTALQKIKELIAANVSADINNVGVNQIDADDFALVEENICKIAGYFTIPTKNCPNEDLQETPTETPVTDTASSGSSIVSTILRRVGIIVGVLILGFIVLVVIFAIRARMNNQQ